MNANFLLTGTSQCVSCSIGSGCKEEVLMVMVVAG